MIKGKVAATEVMEEQYWVLGVPIAAVVLQKIKV